MPLISISTIVGLIDALPKVVAAAPEFEALFDQMVQAFKPHEQSQLKSAYQRARERSDSAQADFQKASRGE